MKRKGAHTAVGVGGMSVDADTIGRGHKKQGRMRGTADREREVEQDNSRLTWNSGFKVAGKEKGNCSRDAN